MYSDRSNPQTGFAALMVCDEANAACPVVWVLSYGSRCPSPTRRPQTIRQTRSLATPRPAMRSDGPMIGILAEVATKLRRLA